ncbi:2'-5' RNA ligase superfamily-domain-containing protein [Lasiosphaeria hispida]|uniref:polynucleotide adenylyltransferase n=1 Tax=Lasiosphaeria hispida TaxID=260671 RepID=A0AAJ0MEK9_9PEZI|nr:2'-5' RNA ligase superfamily-domain-containing protein [Lasiosphaeria hispida]
MATPEPPSLASAESAIPTTSYDTALCIIPPRSLWPAIDSLRSLYDKAYEKWPPHVNLIYPFVPADLLPAAAEHIQTALSRRGGERLALSLDVPGVFARKRDNTIYLHDADKARAARVRELRTDVLRALGGRAGQGYQMHMTVAQSEDSASSAHRFLLDKVGRVPAVRWELERVCLLVRERVQREGGPTSVMKVWGTVRLDGELERVESPVGFYETGEGEEVGKDQVLTSLPRYFEEEMGTWVPYKSTELGDAGDEVPERLAVASYNVLAEFEWPPSQARYPLLLKTILSESASADILVLQEVTDDFLSFLLSDADIRDKFPFTSHGSPSQPDTPPLPSFLNTLILSKHAFGWDYVSFRRKHKGALVAHFRDAGTLTPLILAAVHLTRGLTDGAVAAKKTDVQRLLKYLASTYPNHPLVVAGDFNMATSSYTIDAALAKKAISPLSAGHLASIDRLLAEAGLEDAWTATRDEGGEREEGLHPGEQGATYDPTVNEVAAEIVGSGYGMRPQRYDRILVRGEGVLEVEGFNKFGDVKEMVGGEASYASDHWGVRCVMKVGGEGEVEEPVSEEISNLVVPVELMKAPAGLDAPGGVQECLAELGIFPSEEDAAMRKAAFDLLKSVILDSPPAGETVAEAPGVTSRSQPAVVVVPVGSYALGVWTAASDIDVLCIGPFSSNTFFALATQRLRKASAQGVKILRRVKAHTGTMLELEILDIKMDLQYCPAGGIAQQWPQVLKTPPSDPTWSLSAQTLSKLKAARDLDYLRRSVPDLATFRLAHRFIKTWAKSRGIYSARFGYLGSIQISLLLARVHKLLAHTNPTPIPLPSLLTTFFTHYATFPWATHLAFDPLFHKHRLPYTRTAREPLAILGYFPPALNTSHAASLPSTHTIAREFRHAATTLTTTTTTTTSTWTAFLRGHGAPDFLSAYKSYAKLSIQYWGLSLAKGSALIGWLESRCVMLLVDLARRAPGLNFRIWPARFVDAAGEEDEEDGDGEGGRDYRGCYLVGLDKLDPGMGKEELKVALGGLQTALRRFEEQMRGDERYFDAKSCWLSAEVVNVRELGVLEVDAREWGEYTPGEEEEEEEEGEEEEELAELGALGASSGRKKKGKKGKEETPAPPKLETGKKFRTAADVMNRIRWDPRLDSGDFLVGYEDRFVGAMEKALDAWKSEQTDEEFIPQHRILHFKRKSDGEVLWERSTRKDAIFGSGL